MWLFSYFWGSEIHLLVFAGSFESIAALAECLIAVWIFNALKIKHPTEEDNLKKERLEASFGIIIALLLLMPAILGWRILILHESDEAISEIAMSKLDPLNQPISTFSAQAFVVIRPLNKSPDLEDKNLTVLPFAPDFINPEIFSKHADNESIFLLIGRSSQMTNRWNMNEASMNPTRLIKTISVTGTGEKLIRFDMLFNGNPDDELLRPNFSNASLTPKDFDAFDLVLPMPCEIVAGRLDASIDNGKIKKSFQIPKQTSFGQSVSSFSANGTFKPLNWNPEIRASLKKSDAIRRENADNEAQFMAKGLELESKANKGKKQRTVSDEQKELFINLLKDYPRTAVRVFVNSNDNEAVNYAEKIRQLLDIAGYGNTNGITKNTSILMEGTNLVPVNPTVNTLGFAAFPNMQHGGLFFYARENVLKETLAGITNSVSADVASKLGCVMWAFAGIGVNGFSFPDSTNLVSGECGIVVLPKPR